MLQTIQLKGIFYDLVGIKFGRKEKQGTLVEKVNRAFKNDKFLKLTLYPYFAFDIPDLRNEIAHKGITEFKEVKGGYDTEKIGRYFSVISNEANLRQQQKELMKVQLILKQGG